MEKRVAQAIYGSFKRLGNFPIDPSSYFEKRSEMLEYLANDRTVYPGQMLVVYNDSVDDSGLYIAFEGADKSFKASRISQSEELNEKISNLLETLGNLEQSFKDFKGEVAEDFAEQVLAIAGKFAEQDQAIEDKFKAQDETIATIQSEYATKEEVSNAIETLMDFESEVNITEVIDTFREIDEWVKVHEQELADYKIKLDATHAVIDEKIKSLGDLHQGDIDRLKDETKALGARITSLESGVIKNVLQTLSMDIDNIPTGNYHFYNLTSDSYSSLIPSGYVIQSIRIVTSDDMSTPEDYEEFSVYLALDGVKYKELIEGFTVYPEIDDEPIINVPFSNLGETYIFDTDYEIPFIGVDENGFAKSRDFELKVDLGATGRCKGKLYVNYFKKV